MLPAPLDEKIRAGLPCGAHQTCAGHGGRNLRNTNFGQGGATPLAMVSGPMRKASARWVLRSSGAPTFAAPTNPRIRANVISNFSGSGEGGKQIQRSILRDLKVLGRRLTLTGIRISF